MSEEFPVAFVFAIVALHPQPPTAGPPHFPRSPCLAGLILSVELLFSQGPARLEPFILVPLSAFPHCPFFPPSSSSRITLPRPGSPCLPSSPFFFPCGSFVRLIRKENILKDGPSAGRRGGGRGGSFASFSSYGSRKIGIPLKIPGSTREIPGERVDNDDAERRGRPRSRACRFQGNDQRENPERRLARR